MPLWNVFWMVPRLTALFFLCVAFGPSAVVQAGHVTTDGSLAPRTTLSGPHFSIGSALGQQRGGNLFHSFSTFDLTKSEVATFNGPSSVRNVFARVTGGRSSSIDGTIACPIPNASFYLINPAGVVFGPDAALDVKGSFIVTTAETIKLGRRGAFNVSNPSRTVLISAPPTAFGFLAGNVVCDGGVKSIGAGRTLHPELHVTGKKLEIMGKNVVVSTMTIAEQNDTSQSAGAGVTIIASNVVHLFHRTLLSANGGRVSITAGQHVQLEDSRVTSLFADGEAISITAQGHIELLRSSLSTRAINGNVLSLNASDVVVSNSLLESVSEGGFFSMVRVHAKVLLADGGILIGLPSFTGVRDLGVVYFIPPLPGLQYVASLQPVCGELLNVSTFQIQGRGSVPDEPGFWRTDVDLVPPEPEQKRD